MNSPQVLEGKIISPNTQSAADTQLHGSKLILARIVWAILVVSALALLIASIPLNYAQYLTLCTQSFCPNQLATPDMEQALHSVGLSIQFYAIYNAILETMVVLIYLGIAAILAWRKSNDWIALLVSLGLVTFATAVFGNPQLFATAYPIAQVPSELVSSVALIIISLFFYLFPNGRFVPRWIRWPALLVVLFIGGSTFFPNSPFKVATWPTLWETVLTLAFLGTLLFAQVYRYLRVSTPVQRQQTKWIVFGVIATIIYFLAIIIIGTINPTIQEARSLGFLFANASYYLAVLIIPLAVAFSILRYRLWDIDLLINRTLVYGTLTSILVLIYFGGVILLQHLVRGVTGQVGQSPLVIVGSTLAIAALFQPLRRRIQSIIDRRFYRHKYDAAKTLDAFSATLRNEVDLHELSEQLVAVVRETMQPSHVSLWVRQPTMTAISSLQTDKPSPVEVGVHEESEGQGM